MFTRMKNLVALHFQQLSSYFGRIAVHDSVWKCSVMLDSFRALELDSVDGLPPIPTSLSWARDGLLIVGLQSEMRVYNQWNLQKGNKVDQTLTFSNKDTNSLSVLDALSGEGLFEAARLASPILPQYHPKQLIVLLNAGKTKRVKAILHHVLIALKPRQINFEEGSLDYTEIDDIAPLPLYALFAADLSTDDKSGEKAEAFSGVRLFFSVLLLETNSVAYDSLFSSDKLDDDDLDELLCENRLTGCSRRLSATSIDVNDRDSSLPITFTYLLMYFLAIHPVIRSVLGDAALGGYAAAASGIETVDECGLRYLMAMKQHEYLLVCLPIKQRMELKMNGIASSDIIWAQHSETETELLNAIPSLQKSNPTWEELRSLGIAWWLKNTASLKICVEKVAAKNAFVLMSKQRFQHAAAFFLLSGALRDALQTILHKCNDLQLAMVILRLYESDVDSQQSILKEMLCREVLGQSVEEFEQMRGNVEDYGPLGYEASRDPFVRSMTYWVLKDYSRSAHTLVQEAHRDSASLRTNLSSIFNFYSFLRKHPLVVRQRLADAGAQVRKCVSFFKEYFKHYQLRLYFRTAAEHMAHGCPMLALDVLCRLPKNISIVKDGSLKTLLTEENDDLALKWSDDENEDFGGVDDEAFKSDQNSMIEKEPPQSNSEMQDRKQTSLNVGGTPDVIAQHLKFVASLRILTEELSTLASGYEVDGGQLRYQVVLSSLNSDLMLCLLVWLEKEVQVLQNLCDYRSTSDVHNMENYGDSDIELENSPGSFASYCALHSAQNHRLTSALMELLLLLLDVQKDTGVRHLNESVLDTDSFPLLVASMSSAKMFVPSPLSFIENQCYDLITTIADLTTVPDMDNHLQKAYKLYNLSQGLSSSLYQSLCDMDQIITPGACSDVKPGALVRRMRSSVSPDDARVTTSPAKWPGISNLVFGTDALSASTLQSSAVVERTLTTWLPPQKNIVQFFADKPSINSKEELEVDFDSDIESEKSTASDSEHDRCENANPTSFAWLLLRLVLVEQQIHRIREFLVLSGFDCNEIPGLAPRIQSILRLLDGWAIQLRQSLKSYSGGCPIDLLPDMTIDNVDILMAPMKRYTVITAKQNTPFEHEDPRAGPLRRLWAYMTRQDHLQPLFIRYLFALRGQQEQPIERNDTLAGIENQLLPDAFKIIQKDNEPIVAFACDQERPGWLVVSTGRELQEMDISGIFEESHNASSWLFNRTELDVSLQNRRDPLMETDDYQLFTEGATQHNNTSKSATMYYLYYCIHSSETKYSKMSPDHQMGQSESGNGSQQCHNKSASDVRFLGHSSSVLVTAGASSGEFNLALWDTLLPQNRALVHSWVAHTEGATVAMYLPHQQAIVSGGRHGELCIWDIRQRQLRATVKAFEPHQIVKTLVTDYTQDLIVAGSSDGDIKNEIDVLKAAVQELLQRSDLTLNNEFVPAMEKRKNEFIRFGKRSSNIVKRKNEFIRFGKRKNEFIRFELVHCMLKNAKTSLFVSANRLWLQNMHYLTNYVSME
ncbi:hypothetical protein DICVIV_06823 [Dictyocaulus viviparus]|uniref:RAVE complex protein Rav1 C-terminal domain-containing protein n=1 Tax=Dictyocaulus viviparus TaxID=29172 RepID=A0A0D8XRH0_DICVI|nr:hypothetical protein DICVIV_06823 [Dictyocaulus viviparus]